MTLNAHNMFHVFDPSNVDFTDNVGHILTTNDSGANTQGTGFFLTNFHILTAAHNVFADASIVLPDGSFGPRYDLISASIAPGAYTQTPTSNPLLPPGHSAFSFLQSSPNLNIINPLNYAEDGSGRSDFGDDMALIPTSQNVSIAGAELSSLMVFANPYDAINMTLQVTILGYPANRSGVGDGNNGALHIAFGNNIAVNDISNFNEGPEYVYRFNDIDTDQGVSGAPYFFYVDVNGDGIWSLGDGDIVGVAGVHVNEAFNAGSWEAQASVFTPEHYTQIANSILASAPSGFNANFAARQYLIADQANGGTLNGAFFHESIYGGSGNDIIFASLGNDIIDGGGGLDTVDYRGLTGAITATISSIPGGTSISVVKDAGGTDTLTGIEAIEGTAQADTFTISALPIGPSITINGGPSGGTPQEPLDDKDSGGFHNTGFGGDEDCIIIDQALLDAGAAVTYFSDPNSGVIWLESNGVTQRVTYTGIFHQPQQAPEDFFWGGSGLGDVGGLVNINDIGEVVMDLSASTIAVDANILNALPLFNLVDNFIGTNLGDTIDLALTGLDDFFGGSGDDTVIGTMADNILSGAKRPKLIRGINFSEAPTRLARVGYSDVASANENGEARSAHPCEGREAA